MRRSPFTHTCSVAIYAVAEALTGGHGVVMNTEAKLGDMSRWHGECIKFLSGHGQLSGNLLCDFLKGLINDKD